MLIVAVCWCKKCLGKRIRTNKNKLKIMFYYALLEVGCMLKIFFISCIAGRWNRELHFIISYCYKMMLVAWLFLFSHIFSHYLSCVFLCICDFNWEHSFFAWNLNNYPASSGIPLKYMVQLCNQTEQCLGNIFFF